MSVEKRVFALGFFDGVHLGHQALLTRCGQLAARLGARRAAITFDNHPKALFSQVPGLLSGVEDRLALLRGYGMEYVHVFGVNRQVMATPWQDFLELLVEQGAVGFVCGDDFRFGCQGQGNAELLARYCAERGIPCAVVSQQSLEGIRVSSTHIRGLIEAGDMQEAARFLGHCHRLTGQVVQGRRLGHKLGFPTANVLLPQGVACPRHGVYVCRAWVEGQAYLAVTNVGSRPTVQGHQVRTESWLLDFQADLYGKQLTLEFIRFLRPERKFDSLPLLRQAVMEDARQARACFQEEEKSENNRKN